MTWARPFAVVLALAAATPAAVATDRYYPDSFAVSPNGRFRIDAKSPDNAGTSRQAFAANFTYTLTDVAANKVVWERKQPMKREKGSSYAWPEESSPMQVFINDDGLVAARLAHDSLLLLNPTDGHRRAEADILRAFPEDEQKLFVSDTTAGPMWTQESDWFFLNLPAQGEHPAATYFVVRPYWNHRLIIDVVTGKHVDLGSYHDAASPGDLADADPDLQRILAASMAEESRRAVAVLADADKVLKNDKDYKAYREFRAALHTVVLLKIVETEPRLRDLETSLPYLQLRSKVRDALRSLGKTPAPGYGVRLYPYVDNGHSLSADREHPYTAHVPVEDRLANADKIVVGMSIEQLTDLIGCPDAELYDDDRCYDYDIDAPSPYTLRIYLDRSFKKVEKLRKISPFAFLHDAPRMRGY